LIENLRRSSRQERLDGAALAAVKKFD